MKLFIVGLALLALAGCSEKELRKTLEIINASAQEVPLTREEVSAALKDSLSKGIARGALQASARDGYLANPQLRIPFPPEVKRVEKALRKIGLGEDVERFVRQLNRAAEKAAAKAKPIFIKAITSLTIRDAFEILNGEADAATRYLMRSTGHELRQQFRPIVSDKLGETSATRHYGDIVTKYNRLPLVKRVNPDLEHYATDKAIAGTVCINRQRRSQYPRQSSSAQHTAVAAGFRQSRLACILHEGGTDSGEIT